MYALANDCPGVGPEARGGQLSNTVQHGGYTLLYAA